ncbi:double-CXXCG motif protein [Corallococcus sp. M34]|nr:double-CXXCG motif protein [Citreicoccus inhibens]
MSERFGEVANTLGPSDVGFRELPVQNSREQLPRARLP